MKVDALYIYPIKSLREVSLPTAELTPQGLAYDRRFLLREIKKDGTKRNMACYWYPLMCRFIPSLEDDKTFKVTFLAVDWTGNREILIPLEPETKDLPPTPVNMHGSHTTAHVMGKEYGDWFSDCFGLNCELLYLGKNRRKVLGNLSPNATAAEGDGAHRTWTQSLTSNIPLVGSAFNVEHEQGIGFTDTGALLVLSKTSMGKVNRDLPGGMEGDIKKFRPNIIVRGAEEEFVEDYWRQLNIGGETILLTQNCYRCVSLNLDFDTGKFGKGPLGKVLENLTKDRRVDASTNVYPVFGRYGFVEKNSHGKTISVDDDVEVTATNKERTTFHWPYPIPSC